MRSLLRYLVHFFLTCILLTLIAAGTLWWYFHPSVTANEGLVYGQRHGKDLTLSIYRPEKPTGATVLFIVSGGWESGSDKFQPWRASAFFRHGLTVVAVSHMSQPQATIQEIAQDTQRAVRYVRHHAAQYGLDPQRIGVLGGSSGGHLSLMLATTGKAGTAEAVDPIDREDSSVQAAAVFYPVTDLLNLGTSTENLHDGGPPKSFRDAFGPDAADLAKWQVIGKQVSPIYHVTKRLPPVFIIHGDADTLVPLDQSERFQARAKEKGKYVKFIVRPECGHGWRSMLWDSYLMADWMTRHI